MPPVYGRTSETARSPSTPPTRGRSPPRRASCASWCTRRGFPTRCGATCSTRTTAWATTCSSPSARRPPPRTRATSSFAGMNETFTNVRGDDELLQRVVDCWASLFGARDLAYRSTQGVTAEPAIAVVVQRMVDSRLLRRDVHGRPRHGRNRSHVVIEAALGLGEVVVGGQVEPDTYVVAKDGPAVVDVRVGTQAVRDRARAADGHDVRVELDPATGGRRVLDRRAAARARAARRAGRASLRLAPGHRVGHRGRRDLLRAVAADHHARKRAPPGVLHQVPTRARPS